MCFGVAINNRYCFPFPHQFLRHRFGPTLSPSSSLLCLDGKWRSAGQGPKKAVSPAVTLGTRREGGLTLNGIIVRGQVQAEVGIGRGGGSRKRKRIRVFTRDTGGNDFDFTRTVEETF